MKPLAAVMLVTLVAGCRYRPDPVPLHGSPAELVRLAGQWVGEYQGIDSRRSGSITFTITARGDSAFGDVLMVPRGSEVPIFPEDRGVAHEAHERSPELLHIEFVAVAGGRVAGTLEPYLAPDCSCVVRTTFTGAVAGEAISGTFLTLGAAGLEQRGTWRVIRGKH